MSRYIDPVPKYVPMGRVKFFENRDFSTLKATYSQPDNTIPNTNPVILDGDGNMPACFGEGLYSVKLYDYDPNEPDGLGPLRWARDDVSLSGTDGQFEDYSPIKTYNIGDTARGSDGFFYESFVNGNKGNDPVTSVDFWAGIVTATEWKSVISYPINKVVARLGRLYRSNTNGNLGNTPPAAQWDDLTFNNAISGNFSATGTITANSFVGGSVPRVAKKVLETSRSLTVTLAADPELSIPLATGSFYKVTAHIAWDGNGSAANGLQARIGTTDATLFSAIYISSRNTSPSNVGVTSNTNANVPLGYNILPAVAGGTDILIIEALVSTNGSGSPVVFFEWSQSVSNATTTRVKVPSTLIAIKI